MREDQDQTPLSMTATSAVSFEIEGRGYLLELKSLNSKGLDLKCVLPEALTPFELELRAALSARLARGKVELKVSQRTLTQGAPEAQGAALNLNRAQVEAYLSARQALQAMLDERGVSDLSAREVLLWPQVLTDSARPAVDQRALRAALLGALSEALESLIQMRATEGRALAPALEGHLEVMRAQVIELRRATGALASERAEALKLRLERLLEGYTLDPSDPRLMMEVALIADRSDVTEELNRLEAHLLHIEGLLSARGPIGRRCDFLCQELLRETNTASSKLHEVGITHLLVELKAEVERLREQVQNIE